MSWHNHLQLYVIVCLPCLTVFWNKNFVSEKSGRDWSPLLSSLVQIMASPYFRTLTGFQELVEREWVALGHDFTSRLGLIPDSERVNYNTTFIRKLVWFLLPVPFHAHKFCWFLESVISGFHRLRMATPTTISVGIPVLRVLSRCVVGFAVLGDFWQLHLQLCDGAEKARKKLHIHVRLGLVLAVRQRGLISISKPTLQSTNRTRPWHSTQLRQRQACNWEPFAQVLP